MKKLRILVDLLAETIGAQAATLTWSSASALYWDNGAGTWGSVPVFDNTADVVMGGVTTTLLPMSGRVSAMKSSKPTRMDLHRVWTLLPIAFQPGSKIGSSLN